MRLWSFGRPEVWKNTTKLKANTFGFYALNGRSAVDHPECSKKEDVCRFPEKIRKANPQKRIVAMPDNFNSHKADDTLAKAEKLNIRLVFLPPYSPDLNPIEYIWKSIKRVISSAFVEDREHMTKVMAAEFRKLSRKLSFARSWIKKFMGGKISVKA